MKKPTLPKKTATRADFRRTILAAANRRRGPYQTTLTMRHIQQAVCIVRRRRLVPGAELEAAGYNARERR